MLVSFSNLYHSSSAVQPQVPVGGNVQFDAAAAALQVYVGLTLGYLRTTQVDHGSAQAGAYTSALEQFVQHHMACRAQRVVRVEESVCRAILLRVFISLFLMTFVQPLLQVLLVAFVARFPPVGLPCQQDGTYQHQQ